jgi:hypothetical protein
MFELGLILIIAALFLTPRPPPVIIVERAVILSPGLADCDPGIIIDQPVGEGPGPRRRRRMGCAVAALVILAVVAALAWVGS